MPPAPRSAPSLYRPPIGGTSRISHHFTLQHARENLYPPVPRRQPYLRRQPGRFPPAARPRFSPSLPGLVAPRPNPHGRRPSLDRGFNPPPRTRRDGDRVALSRPLAARDRFTTRAATSIP